MTRAELEKQLADLHYKIADIHLELAAEAAGDGQPARPVAASPSAAPATFSDGIPVEEPPVWQDEIPAEYDVPKAVEPSGDQGSDAICPKHRKPYKEGKFGPYCTSTSDDPAWSNKRGYCSITPRNAAQYLRVKAAA